MIVIGDNFYDEIFMRNRFFIRNTNCWQNYKTLDNSKYLYTYINSIKTNYYQFCQLDTS